jgi:broad specificity phosphatase PhoE
VTTLVHLVRHAAHDNVGRYLAGRTPGVTLGTAGLAQAERLGRKLQAERIDVVQTSPIERAVSTARAIARHHRLDTEIVDSLQEIDFGSWSGRGFDALDDEEAWRRWNAARAITRTPGGETMLGVQARVMDHVLQTVETYRGGTILLVSHADPIRAALALVLGLSLDRLAAFDIDPASISTIQFDAYGAKIRRLNELTPPGDDSHENSA